MNRKDRIERIHTATRFAVVDNSMKSLLRQAEEIAGFIRYYNLNGKPDGYFNQFLQDLSAIRETDPENFGRDGNTEPAQALLFTFISQLHEITEQLNTRWDDYAYWYFLEVLKLKPLPSGSHKVCLALTKNTGKIVIVNKDFDFRPKNEDADSPLYRLTEDAVIENTSIENVLSIYFHKQKGRYPASDLGFVTSLKVKNLLDETRPKDVLFGNDRENAQSVGRLGFMITSPSLLLREGKRTVHIVFEPENGAKMTECFTGILHTLTRPNPQLTGDVQSVESAQYRILHNVFYLRLSTATGWQGIENYVVKLENGRLVLKFALPEDFPETVPCNQEIHRFQSVYPAIKIALNLDAWLYPYSWLKTFSLKKIRIRTEVEGMNHILVYNDLGRIDCSKPFSPFGINTEKGAWMVIGNYEMAVKNTQSIHIKIKWAQLPSDAYGLQSYYAGYGRSINNTSFKVQAMYLSDYQWKEIDEYALFGAIPNAPLESEMIFPGIRIGKMPPVRLPEEQYEYSIRSKTGFVNFVLTSPDIGFGGKHYRTVYTEYLTKQSLRRWKKRATPPNEPLHPAIKRITLNYTAEEELDLSRASSSCDTAFYQISPFGYRQIQAGKTNQLVSPVFGMEQDAHILIALKNLRPGGVLSLYIDFLPFKKEINLQQIPRVKWYLGNGYDWELIPDGYIGKEKTANLLVSGFIKIYLPENVNESLFCENGTIWLRIGIEANENVIPGINKIHINVAEVRADKSAKLSGKTLLTTGEEWKPETGIPGLTGIRSIASYTGRETESRENQLMRISEYVSHRGTAITVRDYERITLQAFPHIAQVKCLPAFNIKSNAKNTVTLVVVPRRLTHDTEEYWRPMCLSRQILKIEQFFTRHTSAYVRCVDVINPIYDEVIVRCNVTFKGHFSSATCRTHLSDLFDYWIAPWQKNADLPEFDRPLDLKDIVKTVKHQAFVAEVCCFSVVVITEKGEAAYGLSEYEKGILFPSTPYAIFVPSKKHIIQADVHSGFGIGEMSINDSFLISKHPVAANT